MMPRPIVYFMIGIPGSGKSTLAQTLDGIVVSSDEIRKEFSAVKILISVPIC